MRKVNDLQGVIICSHCANGTRQILRAVRSEPVVPEDSGWQFVCALEAEDGGTGQLWTVAEVLKFDPSLKSIIESPAGAQFQRGSIGDWQAARPS